MILIDPQFPLVSLVCFVGRGVTFFLTSRVEFGYYPGRVREKKSHRAY
jgi:hypothetical protein